MIHPPADFSELLAVVCVGVQLVNIISAKTLLCNHGYFIEHSPFGSEPSYLSPV
ncbi:MAG: hypothetical protein HC934_02435 [Acaryochloridaceae cyanobacterium SU_2_1]|nr:hypothetical protein [Acaryochloridaceae cyanobacterium SU_2_1]